MNSLRTQADRLQYVMKRLLHNSMQKTDGLARRLISPSAYIERERNKLHTVATRLVHISNNLLVTSRYEIAHWNIRLKSQLPDIKPLQSRLVNAKQQLSKAMTVRLAHHHQTLSSLSSQLELLSPERTLERGYRCV